MSADKIADAIKSSREEMLLQIADRLQKQYATMGADFVSLAMAAMEVIDDWRE